MIIGIGCDIVEHQLTDDLDWGTNLSVQKRIFTDKELEIYYTKKNIRFLAGRFAVKEAILKCLGTGMQDGIALTDIEALKNEFGKPYINLNGSVKEISERMGINNWQISITHSSNYSMAVAIAECT